jgi:hypothetical protein
MESYRRFHFRRAATGPIEWSQAQVLIEELFNAFSKTIDRPKSAFFGGWWKSNLLRCGGNNVLAENWVLCLGTFSPRLDNGAPAV